MQDKKAGERSRNKVDSENFEERENKFHTGYKASERFSSQCPRQWIPLDRTETEIMTMRTTRVRSPNVFVPSTLIPGKTDQIYLLMKKQPHNFFFFLMNVETWPIHQWRRKQKQKQKNACRKDRKAQVKNNSRHAITKWTEQNSNKHKRRNNRQTKTDNICSQDNDKTDLESESHSESKRKISLSFRFPTNRKREKEKEKKKKKVASFFLNFWTQPKNWRKQTKTYCLVFVLFDFFHIWFEQKTTT